MGFLFPVIRTAKPHVRSRVCRLSALRIHRDNTKDRPMQSRPCYNMRMHSTTRKMAVSNAFFESPRNRSISKSSSTAPSHRNSLNFEPSEKPRRRHSSLRSLRALFQTLFRTCDRNDSLVACNNLCSYSLSDGIQPLPLDICAWTPNKTAYKLVD